STPSARPRSTVISALSLHAALPISRCRHHDFGRLTAWIARRRSCMRWLKCSSILAASASRPPHWRHRSASRKPPCTDTSPARRRSEEHTSELQSRENLVCRLLLEKK